MRVRLLHLLLFFTLIAGSGISSGALLTEHTTEEWRSILAVPDSSAELTGLQISLAIDPDQYYQHQGSSVNISGEMTTIFGPVRNAPIILARGNNTSPHPFQNLTTDENGDFSYTDTVNTSGIIRYQAWFEKSDLKGKNITKSYEIEIRSNPVTINQTNSESALQATAITGEPVSDGVPVLISGIVSGLNGADIDANVTILMNTSAGEQEIGTVTTSSEGYFELNTRVDPTDLPIIYLIKNRQGNP